MSNQFSIENVTGFLRQLTLAVGAVLCALFIGMVPPATAQQTEVSETINPSIVPDVHPDPSRSQKKYLLENPISPPDTSSPRATIESFLFLLGEARNIWLDVRDDYAKGDTVFLSPADERRLGMVQAILEKASQTFDLSAVPASAREHVSIETVLQLLEIFDRIDLPELVDIPGYEVGIFPAAADLKTLPSSWSVPGTNIVIARVQPGAEQGAFLFSKETVERIPEDYETIKTFPLKHDRTEDLYNYYIYTPGGFVAPKWYDFLIAGPDWLQKEFYNQTVWQWAMLAILTLLFAGLPAVFLRRSRRSEEEEVTAHHQIRQMISFSAIIFLALLYRYLCNGQINITGGLMQGISTVTTAIVWSCVALLTYQLLNFLYSSAIRNPAVPTGSIDASLLRTGFRVFSCTVALIIMGYGATQIGIPVYGVIAGLGVGGLAIALAAQPTIENLIGGIILYADRMVRVGEFCQFDNLSGTVESIGIRSTRIRALDRTVITISNADLAKRKITNFSRRDQFHLRHRIGLRYETTQAQLTIIIDDIHKYLEDHIQVKADPLRVRFVELGDYSLNIEIYAYVDVGSMPEFLRVQEEVLMKIVGIVRARGADFAFPSTTTYLASDSTPEAGSSLIAWPQKDDAKALSK
ncbi:mechanosensitive ion channel family protein [Sneathiella sp. HT1-7]|uniref:mechanosensitive ion channel family protein n=1 Tax=Sneathiella sp. HT1-7 TaxID=2887192 RepID=UPI001D151FB2|nr:mechanosensitive ion channel family protein [Sneathiella sp. HT1-7]MCC3306115.1 mechanosensitive ion channel family protein [Sneathiella sp. HT1-7]